jgi:hypothetical protein
MDSELKDLLQVTLDESADWDDRVTAFRNAVSACQEPPEDEEEEYEEDEEEEEERKPGKGLMLVFGGGPGKARRR